jgi:hypothetical protein
MAKDYSYEDEEKLKSIKYEVNIITKEKLDSYFKITSEALGKVKNSPIDEDNKQKADDFLLMATSYFNDAKHFAFEKKDFVLAYGALNYAHAWLDAGARIRLFKVKDSRLFTVDD